MTRFATATLGLVIAAAPMACAGAAPTSPPAASPATSAAAETGIAMIRDAIAELRFMDAERLLDEAAVSQVKDDRLTLLAGELELARHQLKPALAAFDELESRAKTVAPATLIQARTERGITLSLLGRSDDAIRVLTVVTQSDPTQWRAWNALGSEYDARRAWDQAEAAYAHAMEASNGAALVLNNRGYSRLLQKRYDESAADFVAALNQRPDFPEARANLRIVLAMKGDFAHAIQGGGDQDEATLLNNAGFAAAMQGDYARAEDLLTRAMKLRGSYFERAGENLKIVNGLSGKDAAGKDLAGKDLVSGDLASKDPH